MMTDSFREAVEKALKLIEFCVSNRLDEDEAIEYAKDVFVEKFR